MNATSPDAAFDVLSVVSSLTRAYESASLPETQAVAYLACLLSVYDGRPSSDWGYEFAATDSTTPFSASILEATETLRAAGLINSEGSRFTTSADGSSALYRWEGMHRFAERQRYLRGALGATDALPLPALSSGLLREPQIAAASTAGGPRPLLDDFGRAVLYRYFKVLEEALGVGADLLVPAVVWLTYLLGEDEAENNADLLGGAL